MFQTIRKWLGYETYEPEGDIYFDTDENSAEDNLLYGLAISLFSSIEKQETATAIKEVILEHFDEQKGENGVVYLSEKEQEKLFEKIDTRMETLIDRDIEKRFE